LPIASFLPQIAASSLRSIPLSAYNNLSFSLQLSLALPPISSFDSSSFHYPKPFCHIYFVTDFVAIVLHLKFFGQKIHVQKFNHILLVWIANFVLVSLQQQVDFILTGSLSTLNYRQLKLASIQTGHRVLSRLHPNRTHRNPWFSLQTLPLLVLPPCLRLKFEIAV
jgi:hypothetical protein